MKNKPKIIRLSDYSQIAPVLDHLKGLLEDGRLKNIFVAYEYKDERFEPDPAIVTFFNGDDRGVILLGLLRRVDHHINQWMDEEENDE